MKWQCSFAVNQSPGRTARSCSRKSAVPTTGTVTAMRGSRAGRIQLLNPPPDAPVMPTRAGSISDRASSTSSAQSDSNATIASWATPTASSSVRRWSRTEIPRSPWPNGSYVRTAKPRFAIVIANAWNSGRVFESANQ